MKQHRYEIQMEWNGNDGYGTRMYRSYRRDHSIWVGEKPPIPGSSDPAFLGDPRRYNPEELLVASLSACHLLWYLHLCADHGIVVSEYHDRAEGRMETESDGAGRFVGVVLHPHVVVRSGSAAAALELHGRARSMCFIANSV